MADQTAPMIYITDFIRNWVIKIGVSLDPRVRERQLRRELKAERLELFRYIHVPHGWGSDREWESELLFRSRGGRLQLFSESEDSTEVADCSPDEAWTHLKGILARTEIDIRKDAYELHDDRVDWRFYNFYGFSEAARHKVLIHWRSLCHRQRFINFLREEPWALIPRKYLEIDLQGYERRFCALPSQSMEFHDCGRPTGIREILGW